MAKPRAEVRESLEKQIEEYVSGRLRGQEAYEFNIKIHKIDLPRGVRRKFNEDVIDDTVAAFMRGYLQDFADRLKGEFKWIHNWHQEGRSGGWLVLEPDYGLIGKDAGVTTLRQRLKDLETIDEMVKKGVREVTQILESEDYWDLKKQDWSPRD